MPPHPWFHLIWCSFKAEVKGSGFLQHIIDKAARILKHPQVRAAQVDVINTLLEKDDKELVTIETLPPPPEIVVVALREEIRSELLI